MALMPVCSGSCTGLRPITPGAWISMRRSTAPAISPWPSIGSPSALTTRPSTASPTGTDRMRPVARTAWPSSMCSTLPSTTAPIESSSRFSARPTSPLENSRISFTEHPGRPETRAMPSPTSRMRPMVPDSIAGSNPSKFWRIAEVISAVLMERSVTTGAPSSCRAECEPSRRRLCRRSGRSVLR